MIQHHPQSTAPLQQLTSKQLEIYQRYASLHYAELANDDAYYALAYPMSAEGTRLTSERTTIVMNQLGIEHELRWRQLPILNGDTTAR